MVVNALIAFLTTVGIDFSIFCGLFAVFAFYRTIRSKKLENPNNIPLPPEPPIDENLLSFYGVFKKSAKYHDVDIIEKVSLEAFLYLRLLKLCAIMMFVLSIFGMSILVPIYWNGTYDPPAPQKMDHMKEMTMIHIEDDPEKCAAPTVFIGLYTCIAYYFAYRYHCSIKEHSHSVDLENKSVLIIEGVDRQKSIEENDQEFRDKLDDLIEDKEVADIYVIPDFTKAYQLKIENKHNEEALERVEILNSDRDSESREQYFEKFFTQKKDAVAYHMGEQTRIKLEYELAIRWGQNHSAGQCFVFCSMNKGNMEIAKKIKKLNLVSFIYEISPAPRANYVMWQNLDTNIHASRGKTLCLTAAFFVLWFFAITPTNQIKFVRIILDSFGTPRWADIFVTNYLPTILIFIFQNLIIPTMISFIVAKERHHDKDVHIRSKLDKYLLFFVFNIFLIPTIFTGAVGNLLYGSLGGKVGTQFISTGTTFLYYMTHCTFIANGMLLLQLPRIIKVKYKQYRAVTEKEKLHVWTPSKFKLYASYAEILLPLIIALSFSITVPLITVVAWVYFTLRYWIEKYNFMAAVYIDHESGGEIPRTVLKYFLTCVWFLQFFTALILLTIKDDDFYITSCAIILFSGVLLLAVFAFERRVWESIDKYRRRSSASFIVDSSEIKKKYIHPIKNNVAIQDHSISSEGMLETDF